MKQSLRAKRMAKHHKRGKQGADLNLTSLMDIFTILVFFLLVNSSSVQQLPSSKDLTLPTSTAQQLPEETVVLLVNSESILVQGRLVAKVSDVLNSKERFIIGLLEEMKIQAASSLVQNAEEEGFDVTIMGDKDIPYQLLKKILATLSEANYTNISMAVMKRSDSSSSSEG